MEALISAKNLKFKFFHKRIVSGYQLINKHIFMGIIRKNNKFITPNICNRSRADKIYCTIAYLQLHI